MYRHGSKENKELLEALNIIKEYPSKHDKENPVTVERIKVLFAEFNRNPQETADILLKTVKLTGMFSFLEGSVRIAPSLLVVFQHVWKTYSDFYRAPEHPSVSSNIKGKASGFISKLKDALRCLTSLTENNSDPKQTSTACSEVPLTGLGHEFFGDVQFEILQLKKQKKEEKYEETEARCRAILDYLDLYCSLTTLREFVFLYVVFLCIANGNSQNLAEGYFGVIEGLRKDKESLLKILSEPEAEYAGVTALFMQKDWPMLQQCTEQIVSSQFNNLNRFNGKKVRIVSSGDKFSMFRHPSKELAPFTRKKYIRVFENNKYTEFMLKLIESHFVISLDAESDLWLTIDGGHLITITCTDTPGDSGQFNIVSLANGNIMISCRKYPTCFVTMTSAKDDACLKTKNLGASSNSQWKIILT